MKFQKHFLIQVYSGWGDVFHWFKNWSTGTEGNVEIIPNVWERSLYFGTIKIGFYTRKYFKEINCLYAAYPWGTDSSGGLLTGILFSMIGYFNGHDKTLWVMIQGLAQTLLVRLPLAYVMSIQPNASLTYIGLAAPASSLVGIILNVGFHIWMNRKKCWTQIKIDRRCNK